MALQCVPGFVIEKDLQHALADGSGDTVLDEGLVLEGQTITSLRAGFYVVGRSAEERCEFGTLQHKELNG